MRPTKMLSMAILAVMLAVAIMPSVAADFANLTLNAPADSAIISGTSVLLNATSNVTGPTAQNVTFQVRCTDNINSSYNTINITTNTTTNQFTTRFDSTTVEDSSICEIKAFLGGNDTGALTDTNNLIRVDNQVPTVPTNPTRAVLRTSAASINITVNTTSVIRCRLVFTGLRPADAVDINNVTESGGVCSFAFTQQQMSDGIYRYQSFATDNANETASAGVSEIELSRSSSNAAKAGTAVAQVEAAQAKKGKDLTTLIIVGLALYGLYWYTSKRK